MRERTPSADDTPKRAPPAPPREAASADVLVDGRSAKVVVADSSDTSKSTLSSSTEKSIRTMVASKKGANDFGIDQPTVNDRSSQQQEQQQQQQPQPQPQQQQQQTQQPHTHNYFQTLNLYSGQTYNSERPGTTNSRTAQTAQDKRSRLSNVINNLRKKVPTESRIVHDSRRPKDSSSEREESKFRGGEEVDDSRNSVKSNLADLEKYVMTVLNGVIKDAESKDEVDADAERLKSSSDLSKESENSIGASCTELSTGKNDVIENVEIKEPSRPNASRLEATVPVQPELAPCKIDVNERITTIKRDERRNIERAKLSVNSSHGPTHRIQLQLADLEKINDSSLDTNEPASNEVDSSSSVVVTESRLDERKSNLLEGNIEIIDATVAVPNDYKILQNRSLGKIILERLTDHPVAVIPDERYRDDANSESMGAEVQIGSESDELRTICRDLLNELLNDISHLIQDSPKQLDDPTAMTDEKIPEDVKNNLAVAESTSTSIQCSLPLDKVASILKNCKNQTDLASSSTSLFGSQRSPEITLKPPLPTIRHLCLYCDRKFLSISLRQRHTDRVHQLGGGRRSERNSRTTTQNCQYCSDKRADNLDSLFQHMIDKHAEKYHACIRCTTRYSTRDGLMNHMTDVHSYGTEKTCKDTSSAFKEPLTPVSRNITSNGVREKTDIEAGNDLLLDNEHEQRGSDTIPNSVNLTKSSVNQSTSRDVISNPVSPEFDSAFYSSVSCNIRENLLHHLDGKLQTVASSTNTGGAGATMETKSPIQLQQDQQHQSIYENNTQFPIDISLTAATPVYSKESSGGGEFDNSSEYAQKPGKTGRSHPRRVSFEKYNFPRKYDGKEPWSFSIKDLSKFDITTQLTLRKKQQLIKERLTTGRLQNDKTATCATIVDQGSKEVVATSDNTTDRRSRGRIEDVEIFREPTASGQSNMFGTVRTCGTIQPIDDASIPAATSYDQHCQEPLTTELKSRRCDNATNVTEFTAEFGNFLRLRKWDECKDNAGNSQEIVYAELTGEWSRPRIYICGACTSRHATLREMEEHKASSHPNVWCSHLEFTGDQRELYKHLFLPGKCSATAKAKNALLAEKVCTKCSKICGSFAELHRHMLECGGDQAWLLGLFGNGKKKCKWRPFGSRSRRRSQRGMKRNIHNSQTPRVNQPKERNSSGPRVRPSDRESIQKMLANLPPKRASRRVMHDTTARTQGRLRKMQTRSKPRSIDPIPSNSRLSRKAVLRNKLLKNAKSFQRKRCRGDNIMAAIECVVKKSDADRDVDDDSDDEEVEDEEEAVALAAAAAAEAEGEEEEEDVEEEEEEETEEPEEGKEQKEEKEEEEGEEGEEKEEEEEDDDDDDDEDNDDDEDDDDDDEDDVEDDSGRVFKESRKFESTNTRGEISKGLGNLESSNRSTKIVRGVRVVSKKRNVKSKNPPNVAIVESRIKVIKRRQILVNNVGEYNRRNWKSSSEGNDKNKTATNYSSDNQADVKRRSSNSSSPSHSALSRRKKHVNPVISLHASLKARNQLRTHDGKFARKNTDMKGTRSSSSSVADKSGTMVPTADGILTRRQDTGRLMTRAKLRTSRRTSMDVKLTRRTVPKRNSSDSEKMPTLEAVEDESHNNTKFSKKGETELPILTSAAPAANSVRSERKNSRGSMKISSDSKINASNQSQQGTKNIVDLDLDDVIEKSVIEVTLRKNISREQRPTRTRRNKIVRDVEKSEELTSEIKDDLPAQVVDSTREFRARNRSSLPARAASSTDYSEESSRRRRSSNDSKSRDVDVDERLKKSSKSELKSSFNKPEAIGRANSRQARQERRALEDFSKLREIPDEVKKLLGPSEDLIAQIGLKKCDRPKRNTRHPQKPIANTPKTRGQNQNVSTDDSKAEDSEQKESISLRKSPRYADKKEVKIIEKPDSTENKDKNVDCYFADNTTEEAGIYSKAEDACVDQTLPDELENDPKVDNSIGKRRGRIKSRVDAEDIETIVQPESGDTEAQKDKKSSRDEPSESPVENVDEDETSSGQPSKDISSSDIATLSFEHLQQESNNSNIDSGKENSSETAVNVSKLKVVRPKKSRGLRRDRMGKRNLSNVIGILTEGVNIPVEVQQNVVLTVQTSIEGVTSETAVQSDPSQTTDSNNIADGEASNVKASVKPNESSDAACSSGHSDESDESASKVLQQTESEIIAEQGADAGCLEQIQCYSVPEVMIGAPIRAKPVDRAQPAEVEEPTNDIILDLSRRKPNGKGSFLEKIVSKIAKQKDVLLEHEVGCLLDRAADELTSILDEVSPVSKEPPETMKINSIDDVSNVTGESIALPQMDKSNIKHFIIPPAVVSSNESTVMNNEDRAASIQPNLEEAKNRGEIEVRPTEEQTLHSGILPTASQSFIAPTASLACPPVEVEILKVESKRSSKKRSLDTIAPKKNKRKTVQDNEEQPISSEDEICLADIMKLIKSAKKSTPKPEDRFEQKVRTAKRKTMELDRENNFTRTNPEFIVSSNEGKKFRSDEPEVYKESKRNIAKQITNWTEESKHENISDKDKKVNEESLVNTASNNSFELAAGDLRMPISVPDVCNEEKIESSSELPKQTAVPSVNDKSTKKLPQMDKEEKKSLADEHLNLSDDESSDDTCVLTIKQLPSSTVDALSVLNLTFSCQTVAMPVESFKIPELNEVITSAKKRNTKKELSATEQLEKEKQEEETISNRATELSESMTCTLPKKVVSSEPIDTEVDVKLSIVEVEEDDNNAVNDTKFEKDNSLSEVVPHENYQFKPALPIDSVSSKPDEQEEVNESLRNERLVDDEEEVREEQRIDNSVTDSESTENNEVTSAEKRGNSNHKGKDNASIVDEHVPLSDAKLQRKFAVVHTKSGKMLIVEKKKKFTKEAAKFFCEVCAASFTRKSSLKKHNLSQSHLMQVAKCGDYVEKNCPVVEDDANLSPIDTSDDISEETKDPLATKVSDEGVKKLNTTDKDTNEELCDLLGESLETVVVEASNNAVTQPEECTFGKSELLDDNLEDELLDEEICKITENMTHDEYVLTDHVSPVLPEAASTPVTAKSIVTLEPEETINETKIKREIEVKKINLADEHLELESPVAREVMSDSTVPCLLDEIIENSSSAVSIPNILESSVRSAIFSKVYETMGEEKIGAQKIVETTTKTIVEASKASAEVEDAMADKPSKSRKKDNKQSIDEDNEASKYEIFVPEDPKENCSFLSKDTESSVVNPIEEISTPEPEKTKNLTIEIQSDTAVYEFLPDDVEKPGKTNSIVALDFSNITEKLKAQGTIAKDTTVEFDSDEESSYTNMSTDIRKLLDHSEFDTNNKRAAVESINELADDRTLPKNSTLSPKPVVTPIKKNRQQKTKLEKRISDERIVTVKQPKKFSENEQKRTSLGQTCEKKSARGKNAIKESVKKSRALKPRRGNNTSKNNKISQDTSGSECDDNKDDVESRNKKKIVKCVFGRAFAGEKVDKVKEVLDDWVSRSESESRDDSQANLEQASVREADCSGGCSVNEPETKRSRNDDEKSSRRRSPSSSCPSKSPSRDRTRSRNRKRGRSKNQVSDASFGSDDPSENESNLNRRSRSKNSVHTQKRNVGTKIIDSTCVKIPAAAELMANSRCRQSKKRAEERISKAFEDESSIAFDDHVLMTQLQLSADSTKTSRHGREARGESKNQCLGSGSKRRVQDENSETIELQESECEKSIDTTPNSKRERAQSPDRNSQKTLDSTNDVDETSTVIEAEEDNEDEITMGRLSPLYACDSPASSINSDTNSDEEDNDRDYIENCSTTRRSISAFSGDKLIIRSPPTSLSSNREDLTEVVTIAPTDAIEDNALDVPRDIVVSPSEKSRQGKVLNFDEELFVECCSRLKATTENELRGAKKIKLDHNVTYNRNDDQEEQGFRGSRDRWRDVDNQNSLGSLLESVNQLLGEEMYSGNGANEYAKRRRRIGSDRSSVMASPDVDVNRQETLGYEDSLDVAFEHNNKLRVKIQQRMKESENLIASTLNQKNRGSVHRHHHHHHHHHHERKENPDEAAVASASSAASATPAEQAETTAGATAAMAADVDHLSDVNRSVNNGTNYTNLLDANNIDRSLSSTDKTAKHVQIECSNFRSKDPALGGLLDKALSNLLHRNGKHDHNGSTPMNVLAELACARVPTATIPDVNSPSRRKETNIEERSIIDKDCALKKTRNPIKELFEKKKEMNERKEHQQERLMNEVALREINIQRRKKPKKPKRQPQDFPLIRKSQLGGMVERKKRRDGMDKKLFLEETGLERIKDIYDFDEEESQPETGPGAVFSYRNKNDKTYEVMSCVKTKELDMTDLMTKTIGETLKNGKAGDILGRRLESMINRKFQEIETYPPKTKGALKSFQIEEKQQQQQQQQQQVTGPMDDFVERKQRSRKLTEQSVGKHGRSKRRGKNSKKKTRNAWYENDSSDEFITAAKAEDVGVGITKSQRTCSKGKQNLFAELSTSSESEYEDEEAKRRLARFTQKKIIEKQREKEHRSRVSPELADNYPQEHEDHGIVNWMDVTSKTESKNDLEHKKSESEMSDHPLVIDERKAETDEQRNSDDDNETRYNPAFELDDLYREDSSVADSDPEEDMNEGTTTRERDHEKGKTVAEEVMVTNEIAIYSPEKEELIPLEEALDLLDKNDDLSIIPQSARTVGSLNNRDDANETLYRDKEPKDEAEEEQEKEDEVEQEREYQEEEEEEPLGEYKTLENECAEASIPEEPDEDLPALPEKLSTNEKPQKGTENLPLHVFLSRKVQESKKRKQQQQKKIQEEHERILMELAPTRRQRKCAIGKQGLLAEISSSDEESYTRETCKRLTGDKPDHEGQPRKPKRESKEKRKERYLEKKHEQIIAKEQKAIEEEILRELEKTKGSSTKSDSDSDKSARNMSKENSIISDKSEVEENEGAQSASSAGKKKRQQKCRKAVVVPDLKNNINENDGSETIDNETFNPTIGGRKSNEDIDNHDEYETPSKPKRQSKSSQKAKKFAKTPDTKLPGLNRKSRIFNNERGKGRPTSTNSKDPKERRSSSGKRDSDDEELRTTKCWNKVEEGVGVAIGRRKRAAANQLYYWSSSSDDDEPILPPTPIVEEEDDRQEQHGWIVGDSHKRMITMLAMEKQLKEKRRRSEDEFEPGKAKNKKHRNSTS